ncbi:Chitin binding domain [Trinorchestia longiramus]|nr:Chitin binding domain [Trinorchestia longiramus]
MYVPVLEYHFFQPIRLVLRPGNAVVPTCPENGNDVCINCITKGACIDGSLDPVEGTPCAAGEACRVLAGVATCVRVADVPGCDCGGARQGCDSYNTDQKIYCIPRGDGETLFQGTDCSESDATMTCSKGQCVKRAVDPCVGLYDGFYPLAPNCTAGVFCSDEEEQFTEPCLAGQYFNKATAMCEDFPPNPCVGCTTTRCAIISDCTKYAVCLNGEVLDAEESCPASTVFNSETGACEAGTDPVGVCADYAGCEFQLTVSAARSFSTTTKPDQCTADNVNKSYPHEIDCKKYYTCVLTPAFTYEYVELTCSELEVFNPTSKLCDAAANVPSCIVDAWLCDVDLAGCIYLLCLPDYYL